MIQSSERAVVFPRGESGVYKERKRMKVSEETAKALKIGHIQAEETVRFRDGALKKRSEALLRQGAESRERVRSVDPETAKLLGPPAGEVLVAEGDSWFDYPFHDILRLLEDEYGYEVESVAHKGDRVEEMAYAPGQLEKFVRLLEKVLRRGTVPRAVLLSGGGNDLAGREFGMILNHAASGIAGLSGKMTEALIDERVRMAYVTILSRITRVCEMRAGEAVPIVIHGYDYPVADGRGFFGGAGPLPGPWLDPGFREKGFADREERLEIVKKLIDRFNAMLEETASLGCFGHVRYLDLRGTLRCDDRYREDWANELHPTGKGFEKVTARFAEIIGSFR